jgi:hypothetical protein
MAPRVSIDSLPHTSAGVRDATLRLAKGRPGAASVTLHGLRPKPQQRNGTTFTQDGGFPHPQDETALLIEIDEPDRPAWPGNTGQQSSPVNPRLA